MRRALAPARILAALPLLKAEGYTVLSFSGGEPLLYRGFETVVRDAAELGFQINLVTNGAPVGGRLLELLAEHASLVAISLDGGPALHGEMRAHPQAFAHAERAMDRLAAAGVRFGLAYGLSRPSLCDMPWAVDFAAAKGASLVQFHPFAPIGRGRTAAAHYALDAADKARAYVLAALLESANGPQIQLDLVPAAVARSRRSDYAALTVDEAQTTPLAALAESTRDHRRRYASAALLRPGRLLCVRHAGRHAAGADCALQDGRVARPAAAAPGCLRPARQR